MRTYDNRIKYFELLMKYDNISNYKKYELPEGFIMNSISQEMKKSG